MVSVVVSVAPDFSVGVIELTVEPRAFTRSDYAVGLGAKLIAPNPCLVSLDSPCLSRRNRSISDSGGDAGLLVVFAPINTPGPILR